MMARRWKFGVGSGCRGQESPGHQLIGEGWDRFVKLLVVSLRLLIAVRVVGCRSLVLTIGCVLETLCELFEQEGAFEAHLHDGSVEASLALTSGIVGLFDVVQASLQLDALSVVGLLYRWRERRILSCFCILLSMSGCVRDELGHAPGGAIVCDVDVQADQRWRVGDDASSFLRTSCPEPQPWHLLPNQ